MSKTLSKYTGSFNYFDKSTLIVLSAKSGAISIALFSTVIGAPAETASASFSFPFPINTGILNKLVKTTRNKKKKHSETVMLVRS